MLPGGRFRLTPLYDVMSAQPNVDAGEIRHNAMKLAMAVGDNRHYTINSIMPRHFLQTAASSGVPAALVQGIFDEIGNDGKTARSIKKRFVGYCTAGKTERTGGVTNWRCHHKIKALLKEDIVVRSLAFTPISHLRYGEFEIDLAAGLEEALIMMFKPPLMNETARVRSQRKLSEKQMRKLR